MRVEKPASLIPSHCATHFKLFAISTICLDRIWKPTEEEDVVDDIPLP
jgi:hypothetical protein